MQVGVLVGSYNTPDWLRLLKGNPDEPPATPDYVFVNQAKALGEMVEPLGFDSLWTTEHYGSPYSMSTNPLLWLAYWAARTERIDLGSAVVVAPWWNPVRLAHEISMLDILLGGNRRLLVGLGRGVAAHEYESLGIPRDKSREYFAEVLEILRRADAQERFSFDGEIFKIPPTSIRPQGPHKGRLLDDVRAAFTTRRSAELAAEAGLGQLFVAGEPIDQMREQVRQFNEIRADRGMAPDQPTLLLWSYCAETQEGVEEGYSYFGAHARDANNHYFKWNTPGFAGVKGYEDYVKDSQNAADSTPYDRRDTQPIGTPDQIIKRIEELRSATDMGYLVIHVTYGGMPPEKAERSMRLFAKEVLPALHEMPGRRATGSSD